MSMKSGAPRLDPQTQRAFADAMALEGRSPLEGANGHAAVVSPAPATMPELRAGEVDVGELDTGGKIGLDLQKLIDGRLLIQGVSGAGKSWTLRRLLEQTHGRIPQIIVDPEGEFPALAERFGLVQVEACKLDAAALALAAERARAHRLSLLLDLSELDREDQMKAVAAFFFALIDAPREHWHPVLVAADEAHLFAPFGGQATAASSVRKEAIGAVTDLMSRGRKRGLVGVLATQRLARLAKSVASEVHNFMIGLNTLDLDIRRAAETIGWDARRAFDRLPMLQPGDFVALGPAFSRNPAVLRVGPVVTRHSGAAPSLSAPPDMDPEAAAKLLDLDGLAEASVEAIERASEADLAASVRSVREFIRELHGVTALKLYGTLVPLAPEGARLSDLAEHLELTREDVAGGLELLDRYGAVDVMGAGEERAARISRSMLL